MRGKIGLLLITLGILGAASTPAEVRELQEKFTRGLYTEVTQEASRYLRQKPRPELYALLARAYWKLEQYDAAFKAVSQGLQAFPSDPDLSALSAQIIRARREYYARMLPRWEQELHRSPKDPDLLLRTARAHRVVGDFETAIRRYREAIELGRQDFAVRKELAFTLLEAKRYADAAPILEHLWKERPKDLSLLLNLGWCRFYLGDQKEAERIFRLCLSYRPGWPEAEKGLAALKEEPQQDLVDALEARLSRNPRDLKAMLRLAWLYLDRNRLEETRELLARARKMAPKNPEVQKLEAALREKAEAFRDQEIARLKAHLRRHPRDVQAHLKLGTLLYQVGDFKGSAEHLQAYLTAHPGDYGVRKQLAFVLSWDAQFDKAARLFAQLHRERPEDQEVFLALARNLSWGAHFKEAARVFEEYLQAYPQDPMALMAAGLNYLWWGHYDSAEVYLKKAAQLEPNNPDIQEGLQLAFTARKKKESAEIDRLWEEADEAIEKGNLGLALRLYREYLEKRPQDRNARVTYAKLLYWTGQEKRALKEILFPLLEARPEDYALLRTTSSLLKNLDDTTFTLPFYRKILDLYGGLEKVDAQVLFDLAEHHLAYGDPDVAAEIYRGILNRAPGSYTAREGLKKAEEKKRLLSASHADLPASAVEVRQTRTRFQLVQDIDGFMRSTWAIEHLQPIGAMGQLTFGVTRHLYRQGDEAIRAEGLLLAYALPGFWKGRVGGRLKGELKRLGQIWSPNFLASVEVRRFLGLVNLSFAYGRADLADRVNALGFGDACTHVLDLVAQTLSLHGFAFFGRLQGLALSDSNVAWESRFGVRYRLTPHLLLGYQVQRLRFLRPSPRYWSPQEYRYQEFIAGWQGAWRDRAYAGFRLRMGLIEGAPRPVRAIDGYLSAIVFSLLQIEGSFGLSKVWTPGRGYQDYRTFSAGVRLKR